MVRYPDFIRHIVNPILANYIRKRRNLVNTVEEIKKFLVEAEVKYGFSSFNGDPEKLSDYLMSSDFNLLIRVFKSCNSIDVLKEILNTAKEKYSDLPRVVEAINHVFKNLEKYEEDEGK